MLPLSRVIPALLLGVGVAGVSAGIAAPAFMDMRPTLPLDLSQTTWTITDDNATTRLFTDGRQLQVPVTAQWHMDIQNPADDSFATARIGSSWMRSSQQSELDRLITAQVWSYPLDRSSGQATAPASLSHTIGMPTAQVPIDGLWFKFPAGARKTTYEVFDDTLRATAPAVFDRTTTIDGHELYVYHQEIPPTNLAKQYASLFNTARIGDQTAYLFHSGTRDITVEPRTGLVVDLDVNIHDFYGTVEGQELENSLTFAGSVSKEDTATLLAQTEKFNRTRVLVIVRWGLIVGGAIISLLALIGVLGGYSRRVTRGARGGNKA